MKLLIAADSAISAEVLVDAVGIRPWPEGTTVHVLLVIADTDVPPEVWSEQGYGKGAVRREMERRGEQINSLVVERLKQVEHSRGSGGDEGRRAAFNSVFRAKVVFRLDLRPRSRPQGLVSLDAGQRGQSCRGRRSLHGSDRS